MKWIDIDFDGPFCRNFLLCFSSWFWLCGKIIWLILIYWILLRCLLMVVVNCLLIYAIFFVSLPVGWWFPACFQFTVHCVGVCVCMFVWGKEEEEKNDKEIWISRIVMKFLTRIFRKELFGQIRSGERLFRTKDGMDLVS